MTSEEVQGALVFGEYMAALSAMAQEPLLPLDVWATRTAKIILDGLDCLAGRNCALVVVCLFDETRAEVRPDGLADGGDLVGYACSEDGTPGEGTFRFDASNRPREVRQLADGWELPPGHVTDLSPWQTGGEASQLSTNLYRVTRVLGVPMMWLGRPVAGILAGTVEDWEDPGAVSYLLRLLGQAAIAAYAVHAMAATLVNAVDRAVAARDPYTAGHSRRVTEIALALLNEMGSGKLLDANDHVNAGNQGEEDRQYQAILQVAGRLHDAGKIGVREAVLGKTSRLRSSETGEVNRHAVVGYEILASGNGLPTKVLEAVRHHHERADGSGYPDGLAGEAIPGLARVLAVADTFDAMTSDRPYRPGMPGEFALGLLGRQEHENKRLDEAVFKCLSDLGTQAVGEGEDTAPLRDLLRFRCFGCCPVREYCNVSCAWHEWDAGRSLLPTAIRDSIDSLAVGFVVLQPASAVALEDGAAWERLVSSVQEFIDYHTRDQEWEARVGCLPEQTEGGSQHASCKASKRGFSLVVSGTTSSRLYGWLFEQFEKQEEAPQSSPPNPFRDNPWACGIATCDGGDLNRHPVDGELRSGGESAGANDGSDAGGSYSELAASRMMKEALNCLDKALTYLSNGRATKGGRVEMTTLGRT